MRIPIRRKSIIISLAYKMCESCRTYCNCSDWKSLSNIVDKLMKILSNIFRILWPKRKKKLKKSTIWALSLSFIITINFEQMYIISRVSLFLLIIFGFFFSPNYYPRVRCSHHVKIQLKPNTSHLSIFSQVS